MSQIVDGTESMEFEAPIHLDIQWQIQRVQ